MVTAGIVIAALILIALLRFGISAEYGSDGIIIIARAGLFEIPIYPRKEKKANKQVTKPQKKDAGKTEEKDEEKPGKLASLQEMMPVIKKTLKRLKRRLLVKELTVHYIAAGTDAAKTALAFGAANAAFGVIVPVLENSFRIKRRDLRSSADFCATEPYICVKAAVSLAVWEAVYVSLGMLSIFFRRNKNGKDGKKHGKAPNRRANGNNNAENQGDG